MIYNVKYIDSKLNNIKKFEHFIDKNELLGGEDNSFFEKKKKIENFLKDINNIIMEKILNEIFNDIEGFENFLKKN